MSPAVLSVHYSICVMTLAQPHELIFSNEWVSKADGLETMCEKRPFLKYM